MALKKHYHTFTALVKQWSSIPLLLMRLVLAYGFFNPAKMKLTNFDAIVGWFDQLGLPFPALNAFLATATESLGVILLFLGLGTRLISIPLMITMAVAIVTVHWEHGFEAGNNGFEIPMYYLLMLFTLLVFGSGRWSMDYWIENKKSR